MWRVRAVSGSVFLAPSVNSASTFPDDKAEPPTALGQLLWERTGQYLCFSCVRASVPAVYVSSHPSNLQPHPLLSLPPSGASEFVCFFQCFLDCFSLCPFYLFAFPQAPSLSFCWHVHWSVGQTGNAVSSKWHFSGHKKWPVSPKSQAKFDSWCQWSNTVSGIIFWLFCFYIICSIAHLTLFFYFTTAFTTIWN